MHDKPRESKPQFWRSECGNYLCRSLGNCYFEAWTADGSMHWRNDNRIITWADAKLPRHPMAYSVGAYSAEKTGQKKGSFTLGLLHCDVTKFVEPFKGNTIIEEFDVVFRRKIPPQNVPKWLRVGGGE